MTDTARMLNERELIDRAVDLRRIARAISAGENVSDYEADTLDEIAEYLDEQARQ